jgi:hypothetical protein
MEALELSQPGDAGGFVAFVILAVIVIGAIAWWKKNH